MSNKFKQSRRDFLQNASLMGVAIPFVGLENVRASEACKEGNLSTDSNLFVQDKESYTITIANKKIGKYSGASLQNGELELALPVFGQEILELAPER